MIDTGAYFDLFICKKCVKNREDTYYDRPLGNYQMNSTEGILRKEMLNKCQ